MPESDTDRAVADELAIRNVLALIAQHSDDGSLDSYGELFTPDARWQMAGTAERRGRDDIVASGAARRATGETGPGSRTRHVITTVAVTVDGERAVADSYWLFYVHTDTDPTLRLLGKYRDSFVRTAGRWQVSSRQITLG